MRQEVNCAATAGCSGPVLLAPQRISQKARGSLCVMDECDLPFLIRRVFIIEDVPPEGRRGGHAHRACEQIFLALRGELWVRARWQGHEASFKLHPGSPPLWIPPRVWVELQFCGADTAVMVFASHPYDPGDYITTDDASLDQSNPWHENGNHD
jgi:UDP-2-acetamido-3-amino-2,3-dideoxy-glucuronate N-acetyltransferase